MRKLVAKVLGRLLNGQLGSGFRAWHEMIVSYLQDKREAERRLETMGRIVKRIQNRTLSGAVDAWVDMVESILPMRAWQVHPNIDLSIQYLQQSMFERPI